jgi:hypothetical protein
MWPLPVLSSATLLRQLGGSRPSRRAQRDRDIRFMLQARKVTCADGTVNTCYRSETVFAAAATAGPAGSILAGCWKSVAFRIHLAIEPAASRRRN